MLVRSTALAGAVSLAASPALALVNPFTETFNADAANWRNAAGSTDAAWVATGGPDSSAFITSATNVNAANTGLVIALRGQDGFDSSGDSLVGNWLAGGVTLFSFDVRHDAPAPVSFGARFAPSSNAPGAIGVQFAPVVPGQWATVTIPIDPSYPGFVSFEFGNFAGIFSSIGNVQISYLVPSGLEGTATIINVDVDNVRIVPAPGVLAGAGLLGFAAVGRRRRR